MRCHSLVEECIVGSRPPAWKGVVFLDAGGTSPEFSDPCGLLPDSLVFLDARAISIQAVVDSVFIIPPGPRNRALDIYLVDELQVERALDVC